VLQGGFGSAVLEVFAEASCFPRAFKRLGLPDVFATHAPQSVLRAMFGIDADGIERAALEMCQGKHAATVYAIR
jgi:1-deoxy-D-xylulose-5-phosphate synthase